MRILYFDCFSGISGDMTLAALVDAGADRSYIEQELKKITIEPFTLEWNRVTKCGISALKMDVVISPDQQPHHHRHYSDIVKLIEQAEFNPFVTALSLDIFAKIGAAEAKIHNTPLEKVHFHEVGAIDSIVDIIGVALAIDSLQVDRIISSPVPLGSGTIKIDHGLYPVPAPATLEIMKGLPIAPSQHAVELTTPTGAGIIAGLVEEFSAGLPSMIVHSIGYGAGTRDLPSQPNTLRVVVGEIEKSLSLWSPYTEKQRQPSHYQVHEHHHEHNHEHHHSHDHSHGHEHHHQHEHSHDHEHSHRPHAKDHDLESEFLQHEHE